MLFIAKIVVEHHGAVRQRVRLVVSQVRTECYPIDFLLMRIDAQGGEGAINGSVLVFVHHVDGSSICVMLYVAKYSVFNQ